VVTVPDAGKACEITMPPASALVPHDLPATAPARHCENKSTSVFTFTELHQFLGKVGTENIKPGETK
jgi:hypothetical protein